MVANVFSNTFLVVIIIAPIILSKKNHSLIINCIEVECANVETT